MAVPVTGDWQVYETIETVIESAGGEFDVVLNFDEVGSNTRSSLFNCNWLSVVSPDADTLLGDCNLDGVINFQDIPAMISLLISGTYLEEAD